MQNGRAAGKDGTMWKKVSYLSDIQQREKKRQENSTPVLNSNINLGAFIFSGCNVDFYLYCLNRCEWLKCAGTQ